MNTIKPSESVIVFDLDDTLYAEYEYKLSGIQAVIARIGALYPETDTASLAQSIDTEGNGWLDEICARCGFNEAEKQSLLWQYRLHQPQLTPYCTPAQLAAIARPFAACALITDGRSLTQRLKLEALGLGSLFDDILVSEAYASEKPDGKRFLLLQEKYAARARQFVYIGDNIKKDFITPKQLGWLTIGLRAAPHNIHRHLPDDFEQKYHPHYWIESLTDLTTLTA